MNALLNPAIQLPPKHLSVAVTNGTEIAFAFHDGYDTWFYSPTYGKGIGILPFKPTHWMSVTENVPVAVRGVSRATVTPIPEEVDDTDPFADDDDLDPFSDDAVTVKESPYPTVIIHRQDDGRWMYQVDHSAQTISLGFENTKGGAIAKARELCGVAP